MAKILRKKNNNLGSTHEKEKFRDTNVKLKLSTSEKEKMMVKHKKDVLMASKESFLRARILRIPQETLNALEEKLAKIFDWR